jgi:hypothetical protein
MTLDGSPVHSDSPIPSPKPRKGVIWKWSIAVTVVVLGFLLWQCGSALMAGREQSILAVQHFHDELNLEEYEQIFDEASPAFQQSGDKQETLKFFQAVHNKLGYARESHLVNLTVQSTTAGTYLIAIYNTKFERGDGQERFTWLRKGGRLILQGYNVESKAFIIG